jgi:hypothetical protein
VNVYQNSNLIGTRYVSAWTYYDDGGFIGLWTIGGTNHTTNYDDFGGGTLSGAYALRNEVSPGKVLAAFRPASAVRVNAKLRRVRMSDGRTFAGLRIAR